MAPGLLRMNALLPLPVDAEEASLLLTLGNPLAVDPNGGRVGCCGFDGTRSSTEPISSGVFPGDVGYADMVEENKQEERIDAEQRHVRADDTVHSQPRNCCPPEQSSPYNADMQSTLQWLDSDIAPIKAQLQISYTTDTLLVRVEDPFA